MKHKIRDVNTAIAGVSYGQLLSANAHVQFTAEQVDVWLANSGATHDIVS